MSTKETVTLYRPVGPEELELIQQSGFASFPPRLPEQPVFYPVLTEDYAVKIARDWNVPASGAGYVVRRVALDGVMRHLLPVGEGITFAALLKSDRSPSVRERAEFIRRKL